MVIDQRNSDRTERPERRQGPFVGTAGHDRPWEAAETVRGPFERRRQGNRRNPSGFEGMEARGQGRRRWGRRKTDVLNTTAKSSLTERSRALVRKFREPIIGLTLAGVAAPLINAGVNPATSPGERGAKKAERAADGTIASDRDLEEEVGNYWADAEDDIVRSHTIAGAMTRYELDGELAEKIYDYATKHDIEPDVAFGLVFTESTFRERAISHVGARGLTQLMPRTAKWLEPGVSTRDLFDPDVNLDLGFRYLKQLIEKYDGDVENALTAYNRGPGTVDRILNRGGNPDNGYAGKVMAG